MSSRDLRRDFSHPSSQHFGRDFSHAPRCVARFFAGAFIALAVGTLLGGCATPPAGLARGDAKRVDDSLTGRPGDPERGRRIALARETACVLCHEFPRASLPFMGDIGPPLDGVGDRMTEAALRLQLVAPASINARTPMPAYFRTEGLDRVAAPYRGKPLLDASEIEDVVSYLSTLR